MGEASRAIKDSQHCKESSWPAPGPLVWGHAILNVGQYLRTFKKKGLKINQSGRIPTLHFGVSIVFQNYRLKKKLLAIEWYGPNVNDPCSRMHLNCIRR